MSEGTFSDVAVPMLLRHCPFLSGTSYRKEKMLIRKPGYPHGGLLQTGYREMEGYFINP